MTATAARGTMLVLALVAALGSMAIHMLVPALPMLAQDLHTGPAASQLAISVYLVALGTAQLAAGRAVDWLGRRPVLLAGLGLYALGGLGCALASHLWVLLAARAVQAAGGAAGVVTARVMVGDLFGRDEAAARQATLMAIVLISPALAPVVGGLLATGLGWRAIPALLAGTALAALMLARQRLPHSPTQAEAATANLLHDYIRLFRNRAFAGATLAMAAASSTLYMFLAAAPFLLHDEGLDARAIGFALLTVAVASILGTRLVRALARGGRALMVGAALVLAGPVLAAGIAAAGWHGPMALVAPMLLLGLGAGIAGPAAMAQVLFAEPDLAGTATSLAGATQMLASAAATLALGQAGTMTPLRLALVLTLSGAVCCGAGIRTRRPRNDYTT